MFISFINNLSLLLALSICHSLVLQRWKPETLSYKIITGLLFGGVAVAGMMNPFKFTEGIIFDGRSLVASIAGLFGGPVTAAIVVLIAGYYRIFIIGGGGALMGICVLTSSSGIGVLYHYWKVKNPGAIRPRHLYSLGILVHLCMVLCMFALPSASVWNAIRTLSLPVMILFPIGTVLLGKLLLSQEKNLQTYLALQVSEEKYRDLVENANSVILRVDANGIITFFNEFAQKFFGYTESEIIGKPIVGTIIPEVDSAGKELRHIIRDIFNDPIKYTKNENENICKNGKRVLISWMNKVFIDKTGVPFEMLCIGSDITDQKQAEKALYDSERRYRALVENMPGTVYYTEPAPPWKILYISDEIFNLCGYHAQDFLGNNTCYFDDLIHPDDREKYDRLINQGISNHEPYDIEYRIFHKDKSIRWVHEKGKSIYDENQQPLRLNGVIIDSTEQKRMEEELQKMRKLESVGILAGGIAHDFNNLLTAILGNISVAKSQPLSMDAILTRLGEAEKASLRAQELTRQLLTFSKGGAPVKQTADIKDIVRETALFALRGTNARCDFDFSEDLWLTSLDQGQFSQVIQNLVINAHQAMPHGGKIYIQAENVSIKEKDEILFPGLMEGRYLKLSITDEGIGIPEKDLATIFDPYYIPPNRMEAVWDWLQPIPSSKSMMGRLPFNPI